MKPAIFCALSAVISQHPILSAIPVDEDTDEPYFARLPEINLEEAVKFITRQGPFNEVGQDKELDELLEIQHNKNFKDSYSSLPFWRLLIIKNPGPDPGLEFVASFIFHHALGDGISGLVFHNSFFSALVANQVETLRALVPSPKTELLPTLEDLNGFTLRPWTSANQKPDLWTGEVIMTPLVSRFQSLVISKETTRAFVRNCREHGTTVTAAIQVILAVAIFQAIPAEYTELACAVPISLRHWLPAPIDESSMGNYVDELVESYQRRDVEQFSWAEAQRSRKTMAKYLASGGEYLNVARMKLIRNIIQHFSSQVGKKRTSSFNVSNLGVVGGCDERKGKNWERGRTVFSRSGSVTQSAVCVGLVTGADGCLVMGFAWQEGIVDDEMIELVMGKVDAEIEVLTRMEKE